MADVSAPEIAQAYREVRDDKSETNWLLIHYESGKSDKLKLTATGTGGLEDLKEHLSDDDAAFAYVRITYANDKESKRNKFVLVTWIGPKCKIMRKAKVSVQAADVKKVLSIFSIDVPAREKEDLEEGPIITRLRKAGGASYDGV